MPRPSFAFATLLTTDSYLPGALTLAAALHDVHTQLPAANRVPFETVCLVTPETVDVKSIKALRKAFDVVVGVEVLEFETNQQGLSLLGAYSGFIALSNAFEMSPVLLSTLRTAYQSPLCCNLLGTPFWAEYSPRPWLSISLLSVRPDNLAGRPRINAGGLITNEVTFAFDAGTA